MLFERLRDPDGKFYYQATCCLEEVAIIRRNARKDWVVDFRVSLEDQPDQVWAGGLSTAKRTVGHRVKAILAASVSGHIS